MSRVAFTVTKTDYDSIYVRSIATGKTFKVKSSSSIGAKVGDTVSVIMDNNNNWKTIINERTGNSATVTYLYKYSY